MSAPSGLRLFGVAEVEHGSDPIAEGTTLVHHRGLGAIVEPANYAAAKPADVDLDRYAGVIEEAFRAGAVLPAPPGTVFKSQGTLAHWLELHYFTLTDALTVVEDHCAARVSISAAATAKEDDAAKSVKALSAETLRHLRGHAAATVTIPLTEDESKEGVVASASFLVPSDKWDAFQGVVSQEGRRHPALSVNVTGPWPPYDFVRMQFGG
jgi:hypothetical protein